MLFMKCVVFSKMTSSLIIHEQAKLAASYDVRHFIVLVQRRWGACKGRHETLRPETLRGCFAKFMTNDFVNDKRSKA